MKRMITLVIMAAVLLGSIIGASALTTSPVSGTPAAEGETAVSVQTVDGDAAGPEYAAARSYTINRSNVRVYGRQEPDANTVFAYWEGAGIGVRFIGTKLTLTMSCSIRNSSELPYFQVWVDGERTLRFNITNGTGTYTVADNLSGGEHYVRVLLTTQSFYDQIQFATATITGTGAELLDPVYDSDQLIMDIYGDSITAGHGTLGNESDYTFRTNDATSTYAYVTAEHFGADANVCAISGWGMYQGYNADRNGIIPRVWNYISMRTSHIWTGFADRQADVVTVALGTNDMWFWKDEMSRELYIGAYMDFLGKLREVYPEASFFLLHNMMDDRTFTDEATGTKYTFCDNVAEVARRFCEIDEIGATFIRMPSYYTKPEYTGSGGHPSEAYSYAEYHHLAEAIEERFYGDWEYKLLAAAEELELLDSAGAYAETIAYAKQTAADWHSTGRNPKRFCKEIEAIIEGMDSPAGALSAAVDSANTVLAGSGITETERRAVGILAARASELIEDAAGAAEMAAAASALNEAVSNIGNAAYFENLDLGGSLISAKLSLNGSDFVSNLIPAKGEKVYVRVRSAVPKDEIGGKLTGDPYRSSRRGVKLNTAAPESESFSNGVYEYVFSAVAGASNGIELSVGGEEKKIEFAEVEPPVIPVHNPEFSFVSDDLKQAVTPAAPAAPVLAAAEKAASGVSRIAVVGGDIDMTRHVWEVVFGAGSVDVRSSARYTLLTACAAADGIISLGVDAVILNVGSDGLTVDEDKEAYESLIRKLLTADNAPAILCVLATGDAELNASRAQLAAAYGLPCADADMIISSALAAGYANREIRLDNGRLTALSNRMITEAAIYGLYASAGKQACALPAAATALRFSDIELLTPDNTTPKSMNTYTVAASTDPAWSSCWMTATGRGSMKFDLTDCKSIIVIYGDRSGNETATIIVKAFGKNKSKVLNFEPYSTNAFVAYLGDTASGELSLTPSFRGESAIYAIVVGH